MINVIALTQFAFLALGIASLKILIQADTGASLSPSMQMFDRYSLWLFFIPVLWIGFASLCQILHRGPFNIKVARILGVGLAILSLLFLISVTFLTSL